MSATFIQGIFTCGDPLTIDPSSGNGYVLPQRPVSSGNCLLLTMSYVNGKTISSISDTVNGSWSTTPIAGPIVGANATLAVFAFPGSGSGTATLTITFNATQNQNPIFIWEEWAGIATSTPGNGSHGAASQVFGGVTPIACGSFTPGDNDANGGNLIRSFFQFDGGASANVPSLSFSPSAGFTLMNGQNGWQNNGTPHASAYQIQSLHPAVNPGMSPTNDTTDAFNCLAVALKLSPGAGTIPATGVRLVGFHEMFIGSEVANWTVQFPTTGTFRMMITTNIWNLEPPASVTDSEGNTWTSLFTNAQMQGGAIPVFYFKNATPNSNLTVTIHVTNPQAQQSHCALYDIVGAHLTSPIGNVAHVDGTVTTASQTSIQHQPDFTPSVNNSMCVYLLSNGNGPTTALTNPANISDILTFPQFIDLTAYSSGDGWAHAYNQPTTLQNCSWTFNAPGFTSGVNSLAFEILPGPAAPIIPSVPFGIIGLGSSEW